MAGSSSKGERFGREKAVCVNASDVIFPAAVIIGTTVAAIAAHSIVRRRVGYERLAHHNDVTGYVFSAVGVIYAVVLGFVVVIVWQKYDGTVQNTQSEVAGIADVYRTVGGFPDPQRSHIRGEVKRYITWVVHDEWPAIQTGHNPSKISPLLEHVGGDITYFEPKTPGQIDVHQAALAELQRAFDTRRLRIEQTSNSVPPILWFTLIVGAVATLSFSFFFGMENRGAQILMTGILAALIAMMFVVIYEFSSPLDGIMRVPVDGWAQLLARLPNIR